MSWASITSSADSGASAQGCGVPAPVVIEMEGIRLHADLTLPPIKSAGVVMFAHGSGSSRLSPRNRAVASCLVGNGLATILLDLLTEEEEPLDEVTRKYRFDIPRLAKRLVLASDWLAEQPVIGSLPLGYFGASTGAAAALIAAAERAGRIAAVVSRGGRPDLAQQHLPKVQAPTLLIIGGRDSAVIELNRHAASLMRGVVKIEIVPGATHLFEERGALERVSDLACTWFLQHMRGPV